MNKIFTKDEWSPVSIITKIVCIGIVALGVVILRQPNMDHELRNYIQVVAAISASIIAILLLLCCVNAYSQFVTRRLPITTSSLLYCLLVWSAIANLCFCFSIVLFMVALQLVQIVCFFWGIAVMWKWVVWHTSNDIIHCVFVVVTVIHNGFISGYAVAHWYYTYCEFRSRRARSRARARAGLQ